MSVKTVFLMTDGMTPGHIYKEHGEILYYLSKIYGCNCIADDFIDPAGSFGKKFRTVKLHSYSCRRFIHLKKFAYLFKKAKNIDILYLLCITPDSMYSMLAYRLGGGRGKIFLKTDLGLYEKDGKDLLKWENMTIFLKIVHCIFKIFPDVMTVETRNGYSRLQSSYYGSLVSEGKLYYLPNGVDPEILVDNNIRRKKIYEKEKLIITVGRIGTYQKNTELLLDILSAINLKDWKVKIIGGIESSFQQVIENFYLRNPEKRDSVLFTGPVSQKELWEYYNRSRIFLFTSRHESYGLALSEAMYMGDYVITTNVGIASELSDFNPCYISQTWDKHEFIVELNRIIGMNDEQLNDLMPDKPCDDITWEYVLRNNEAMHKLFG